MSTEGKVLILIQVLLLLAGIYGYYELHQLQRQTLAQASICRCPINNSGQVAVGMIQRYGHAEITSHSYFERLLEALARKAGLPVEKAREALKRDMKKYGGLPLGWRWLKPWETGPDIKVSPPKLAP